MRWPGIEPGSTAWKAAMLTIIPPSLHVNDGSIVNIHIQNQKVSDGDKAQLRPLALCLVLRTNILLDQFSLSPD